LSTCRRATNNSHSARGPRITSSAASRKSARDQPGAVDRRDDGDLIFLMITTTARSTPSCRSTCRPPARKAQRQRGKRAGERAGAT
jgi:hypothetical protein